MIHDRALRCIGQPMFIEKPAPMFAPEIAKRLGCALATFYRNRQRLHLIDKMPRPINQTGRPAFDREGMEAWLTRNDPRRPKAAAANDDALPPPAPNSDAEWRAFLQQHYGPAE